MLSVLKDVYFTGEEEEEALKKTSKGVQKYVFNKKAKCTVHYLPKRTNKRNKTNINLIHNDITKYCENC